MSQQADRPVLVLGRSGQVARALAAMWEGGRRSVEFAGRPEIDLARPETLEPLLDRTGPRIVVNAAAYTAVERAEQMAETARAVNAGGPAHLASLCRQQGVPLIHLSTDYVFAGTATTPYRPDHPADPQNAYGRTKAEGEDAIRNELPEHVILRTAWLYDAHGENFLRAMLRAGAEGTDVTVVDDQTGTPTYAADLASAIGSLIDRLDRDGALPWGTYHLTNRGETTWFGFATAIFAALSDRGLRTPTLIPVSTADYPAQARRPAYSVLDTSVTEEVLNIVMPDWQDGLHRCLERIDLTDFGYREAAR